MKLELLHNEVQIRITEDRDIFKSQSGLVHTSTNQVFSFEPLDGEKQFSTNRRIITLVDMLGNYVVIRLGISRDSEGSYDDNLVVESSADSGSWAEQLSEVFESGTYERCSLSVQGYALGDSPIPPIYRR